MSENINGSYISEDGNYILIIKNSNIQSGKFDGIFTNKNTPIGEIKYQSYDCRFDFVSTKYPCAIGFIARYRTSPNWDYVIYESWSGYMTARNELCMAGSRSYARADGKADVYTVDKVKFLKQ